MTGDFADETSLWDVSWWVIQLSVVVAANLFVEIRARQVSPSRARDQLVHKLTAVGIPRSQ